MVDRNVNISNTVKIDTIDTGARQIMYTLEYHGYPTYIVGGCVRDLLLGKTPHDWDITTKAKPQEVADIAIKSGWKVIQNVGNSFGVMIVSLVGQSYEVATFRSECYGEDSHRPSQVAYSEKLEDDVSRRDFTVNAMAIDKDGTLYDFFNGKEDLKNKTLRTVGSAISRFNEDALRLFRACRFLAQLGFTADQSLIAGISSALCRVSGLSLERVRIEVNKILVAPYASRGLDLLVRSGLGNSSCRVKENGKYIKIPILPELSHLVELPQMKQFHKYDVWNHTLVAVDAAPRNLITRWATLLHDVGKGLPGIREINGNRITDHGHDLKGSCIAKEILTRWRMPKQLIHHVTWIVKEHMRFHYFAHHKEANVKKWIRQMAQNKLFFSSKEMIEAIRELTDVCKADIVGCGYDTIDLIGHEQFGQYMISLAKRMPITTRELHYGTDVPQILSPYVAEGMQRILQRVQNGQLKNEEVFIKEAAIRFRRRKEHA